MNRRWSGRPLTAAWGPSQMSSARPSSQGALSLEPDPAYTRALPPSSFPDSSPLLPQPTCLFLLHVSLPFPSTCCLLLPPLSLLLSGPRPFLPCLLQSLSRPVLSQRPTLPCHPIFLSFSLLLPHPSHVRTSAFPPLLCTSWEPLPPACRAAGPLTLRGSVVSLWGPVHGATPLVPSLLPWLPRRAGSRAQGRETGGGREHLAQQQAGERSGWQSGRHQEGTQGEMGGTESGALRRDRIGDGKGTGLSASPTVCWALCQSLAVNP